MPRKLDVLSLNFEFACCSNTNKMQEVVSKHLEKYISNKEYNFEIFNKATKGYDTDSHVFVNFSRKISYNTVLKILMGFFSDYTYLEEITYKHKNNSVFILVSGEFEFSNKEILNN